MGFWDWWTGIIRGIGLPVEQSAPSDATLLLIGTLPMAAIVVVMNALLGLSLWWAFLTVFVLSAVVRYSPWFRRPEGYVLNGVVGFILGMIISVIITHT